jgi:DNA-binding response OmpR family regulator
LAIAVWGAPHAQLNCRTLDVHVRRIRVKLGPEAAPCLKTVPAVGYQWSCNDESAA